MSSDTTLDITKVGVIGANGKMGTPICSAIESTDDLELVARINHGDELEGLAEAGVEVVVDVTNADAARHSLQWVAQQGMHAVVGTSGFTDQDVAMFDRLFRESNRSCFIVPNFSIGAVLMIRFAAEAAAYLPDAEIIEMHRVEKKDAPSGTSKLTAKRISEVTNSDVPIHSVRLPGLLAHQEVIFGGIGETLTIRHDSLDRSSFMSGVLRSLRSIATLPAGVSIGLDAVL